MFILAMNSKKTVIIVTEFFCLKHYGFVMCDDSLNVLYYMAEITTLYVVKCSPLRWNEMAMPCEVFNILNITFLQF